MVFIPSLTTFFISGLLGGNKVLLIGNIVEQIHHSLTGIWGSGLSLVLMIFIIINMVLTAYFDRSEGQVENDASLEKTLRGLDFPVSLRPHHAYSLPSRSMPAATGGTGRDLPSSGTANCFRMKASWKPCRIRLPLACHQRPSAALLGLVTCLALRGMGRRRRSVLMGIANIPLLNADIVTGISLMLLFLGLGLRLGYGTILMAHIVFNLPYVILCLMPQMLSLNAAMMRLGAAGGRRRLRGPRRVLPELRPSLL